VGGVVVQGGRALLVRRGKQPLRGRWTIPGGGVELGETLEQALVREMREETGLEVRPRLLIGVFDQIERSGAEVHWHHVIVDYLCDRVSGTLRAGSDADAVALVAPDELSSYDLPPKSRQVILEALRLAGAQVAVAPGGARD
jgi:ADP-ribose pyrophosphatase YjhB (NUDIX family)